MHPEQLLRTVGALRDAAAGIEAELERPDAEVRRLGGRWSGEAREVYSRARVQGDLVDTARTGFTRTWANRDKFATVR